MPLFHLQLLVRLDVDCLALDIASIPSPNTANCTHEKRRDLDQWRKENPELCKPADSKVSFQKGAKEGKYVKPDKPDASDTRPNSKKEKQAICSEIASVFKEQFALRDERGRDFDKF